MTEYGYRRGRRGRPKTDEERLRIHFGSDYKNHSVSDLPPRGYRRRRRNI